MGVDTINQQTNGISKSFLGASILQLYYIAGWCYYMEINNSLRN